MTDDGTPGRYAFASAAPGWWAWFTAYEGPGDPDGHLLWRWPVAGWTLDTRDGTVEATTFGTDGACDEPSGCTNFVALTGPGTSDYRELIARSLREKLGDRWSDEVAARVPGEVDSVEAGR